MVCILHYFGGNCASAGYRRIKICDLAVRYGHPSVAGCAITAAAAAACVHLDFASERAGPAVNNGLPALRSAVLQPDRGSTHADGPQDRF